MIITKKALSRRTLLRGAGTALALPVLDAMLPALGGAAPTPPARLAFIYHPVGMILDRWTPKATGAGFEFTPSMKALEPFREYTTVLTGLAQVQGRALGDGPGDHAREGNIASPYVRRSAGPRPNKRCARSDNNCLPRS